MFFKDNPKKDKKERDEFIYEEADAIFKLVTFCPGPKIVLCGVGDLRERDVHPASLLRLHPGQGKPDIPA